MREFSSNLAQKLNDFIDYKHTLGIKYETSRVYLLELDQYNLEHSNGDSLTKEIVEGWFSSTPRNPNHRTGAFYRR